MSRHKLVKNMNVDEELDMYDGYDEESNGEEELSPEDKERMLLGTSNVQEVLGASFSITEKEIQESLWHYYYDVDKTVDYLLKKHTAPPKKSKKAEGEGKKGTNNSKAVERHPGDVCSSPLAFSAENFFRDSPWLGIPPQRLAKIMIEPLHPRGRLLGGSSREGSAKGSKLAALAAARKKKSNEPARQDSSKQTPTSVALLDTLTSKGKENARARDDGAQPSDDSRRVQPMKPHPKTRQINQYPTQPRQAPTTPTENPEEQKPSVTSASNTIISLAKMTSSPSAFAQTILGASQRSHEQPPNPFGSIFNAFQFRVQTGADNTKLNPFIEPSPDDIVMKAQNTKGSNPAKSSTKKSSAEKVTDAVVNGISKVSVQDTSRAKSKNLDVLSEYEKSKRKKAVNFVVIGHVDAGKSTLMGRLLYDLKVVDQRTIDKYRKEAESIGKSSFTLAWVLDQGTEERNRGVTIDIAINHFETENTKFTILDAPGHQDFIPNMIAGASQADFAVLVIDASTGNFESGLKGQTKEHALLVRSMGVQRIIVAINKLDIVEWSKDRFDEIQQQLSAFLSTAGFQTNQITFVPCSGLTGDNIVRRTTEKKASWYQGPIFIDQLESSDPNTRALKGPLRLTIGDVFRGGVQTPLSISGRVDSGSVQVGDKILAIPSGESAFIKAIDVDEEPNDWAVAGQNVTLHLTDIDPIHLKSGDVICSPTNHPISTVTTFTTKILAFSHITPMHLDVHRGRLHAPGRIVKLEAVLDKSSGNVVKKKPKLIQPGSVARVVVKMEQPVPLEPPARVVLRAGGETVAAGLVEKS